MPKFWRKKVILAKLETTYGVDPTPTGAANAILVKNVVLKPMEGQDVSRDLERPWFGAQPTVPVGLHRVLSFEVEWAWGAAIGDPPAFAPLLRACSAAETLFVGIESRYEWITDNPESATLYFNMDGMLFKLRGARGTVRAELAALGLPMLKFEFKGFYEPATDTVAPVPDYAGFQKPREANSANTSLLIGAVPVVARSFALDVGNVVENRQLIGSEDMLITGRAMTLDLTIDAVSLATFDPFAIAASQAPQLITLQHNDVPASRSLVAQFYNCQLQRPGGINESQGIAEWPLRFNVLAEEAGGEGFLSFS